MTKILYGVGVAVLLGWCAATLLSPGSSPPRPAAHAAKAQLRCTAAAEPIRSGAVSYAAIVKRTTVAYRRPGGVGRISRFGRVNQNGFPTVFSVVGLRRKLRKLFKPLSILDRPGHCPDAGHPDTGSHIEIRSMARPTGLEPVLPP